MGTDLENLYARYRRLLVSVAYRMLGTLADAEDIVHDLFADPVLLRAAPIAEVKAYLTKAVANRCLNFLKSARRRRESYPGPWLPEPAIALNEPGPLERIEERESVSYAFLVLLERLSPMERVVFVLKEALGYEYREIADMLGKTEANCRKIRSRAGKKLPASPAPRPRPEAAEQLARSFLAAARSGDFAAFLGLLAEDATLTSDGGGKVVAALRPIVGRPRIAAFLEGLYAKGNLGGGELRAVRINGEYGIVRTEGDAVTRAYLFEWDAERSRISRLYLIGNPDKLPRGVTTSSPLLSNG